MFNLFITFLKIGTFTFGGGYAMVPLIEDEVVTKQKLLKSEDFIDYLSISQSYPGALAINLSVMIGYKLYGVLGALICTIASIIPAFVSVAILAYFYFQNKTSKILDSFFYGVSPVVIALLLYSFYSLLKKLPKNKVNILLLSISFALVGLFGISPIYVIIGGVVFSLCLK